MPPPSQSDNLSMNCFILVKGKSSDVESVCNDIEKLFDNFSLEEFVITCPQFLAGVWRLNWALVKEKLEESHNVIIQYSQFDYDTSVTIFRVKKNVTDARKILKNNSYQTNHQFGKVKKKY